MECCCGALDAAAKVEVSPSISGSRPPLLVARPHVKIGQPILFDDHNDHSPYVIDYFGLPNASALVKQGLETPHSVTIEQGSHLCVLARPVLGYNTKEDAIDNSFDTGVIKRSFVLLLTKLH